MRFIKLNLALLIVLTITITTGHLTAQPTAVSIGPIGFTVSNMDRSIEFYSKVLAFHKVSDQEVYGEQYDRLQGLFGVRMRIVIMQLGDEAIELTEYLTPKGRLIPEDSKSNDLWFQHIAIVVSDMDTAYQKLRAFKVQHVSTAPQTIPGWNKSAAGIRAFYFRDPDRHNLEIIYFPEGKGDPKWQNLKGGLFLGIDHTAIAVSNTTRSLKFYRDVLGMKIAGKSLNYGPEQEHLNHVFGGVQITALRAASGPGIEFLEYLAPADGRKTPQDLKANDLLSWQTTIYAEDLSDWDVPVEHTLYTLVSSTVIEFPGRKLKFAKGILLRDPDGHGVRLVHK